LTEIGTRAIIYVAFTAEDWAMGTCNERTSEVGGARTGSCQAALIAYYYPYPTACHGSGVEGSRPLPRE